MGIVKKKPQKQNKTYLLNQMKPKPEESEPRLKCKD